MNSVRGGILILVVVLSPALAKACQCNDPMDVKVKAAESIFYARISEVRIPEAWGDLGPIGEEASTYPMPLDHYLVFRYDTVEVLKGKPDPGGFVISTIHIPGLCAPPILVGLLYVIFTDSNGFSDFCKGLFNLGWIDPQHEQVQDELAKLRKLVAETTPVNRGDEAPR